VLVMSSNTTEARENRANLWIWVAGAAGTAAGVASLLYTRSRQTPWERAKRKVVRAADTARSEVKPWMGVVAGAAAGSAALAYRLARKPDKWEQARRLAGGLASRTGKELRPWLGLAATAAASVASNAYRKRQVKAARKHAAKASDSLAETGLRLLRSVERLSGETKRLYPRVRKLIA